MASPNSESSSLIGFLDVYFFDILENLRRSFTVRSINTYDARFVSIFYLLISTNNALALSLKLLERVEALFELSLAAKALFRRDWHIVVFLVTVVIF